MTTTSDTGPGPGGARSRRPGPDGHDDSYAGYVDCGVAGHEIHHRRVLEERYPPTVRGVLEDG